MCASGRARCWFSAGPDYALDHQHLAHRLWISVLPAEPVGVTEKPFYAHLSGRRQTASGNARASMARRANRRIGGRFLPYRPRPRNAASPPVMNRRRRQAVAAAVALWRGAGSRCCSPTHIWLWARGYEGGGPHLDLLRRMSHWLMKQPDLDERGRCGCRCRATILSVVRQTMADSVAPVTVTSPSGSTRDLTLRRRRARRMAGPRSPPTNWGLWQASDGTLKAADQCRPEPIPRNFPKSPRRPRC